MELPGFAGSGAWRVDASLILVLVLAGSICNSQDVHNCTDLILTDGTLIIDTDCGVWYLVCDDNNTSCLPYDVTEISNVTYTCKVSLVDVTFEPDEFSDGGSGDDTTPLLWSSNLTQWLYTDPTSDMPSTTTESPLTTSWLTSTSPNLTTTVATEATTNYTVRSETGRGSDTPETTVQPENGTTGEPSTEATGSSTTSGVGSNTPTEPSTNATGSATTLGVGLNTPTKPSTNATESSTTLGVGSNTTFQTTSDQATGTGDVSSPSNTTEGATTTVFENGTIVANVTEIMSTDMSNTTDYTTVYATPEPLDCDQRYNDSVNQHVILRGNITYHTYTDNGNTTWQYGVATFNVNGSLYLGSALRVEVRGQNALRVNSTFGDVIINATIHLDRTNSSQKNNDTGSYEDQHLGGFGRGGGPGEAAPNSSDGAGHGGMGGVRNTSTFYSHAYLVNDTDHLLGGSAGGTPTDFEETVRPFGGGALEIIAARFIYIESEITARGEDGVPDCGTGGGSGGLIRLIADSIYVVENGSLNVEGGHGSLSNNGTEYGGGGGAGGVVQLLTNESCLSVDSLNVEGGVGFVHGEQGVVINNGNKGKGHGNGGGGGGGDESGSSSTVEASGVTEPVQSSSLSPDPVTSGSSPETSDVPASNSKMTTTLTSEESTGSSPPTLLIVTTSSSTITTTATPTSTTTATSDVTTSSTSNIPTTTKFTSNNTAVKQELTNLLASFSVGTSSSNTSSSANISSKEAATQIKALENAVFGVALYLAQGLADDKPLKETIVNSDTAVAIEIVPVADFVGTAFPSGDSNSTSDDARIAIPTVVLPENATGHLVSTFILYTSPPPLGGNLVENNRSDVSFELNSQVISARVSLTSGGAVSFNEPIRIVLRNNQEDSTENSSSCVFYDFTADNNIGAWSTDGCRASDVTATHVTCSCDHLTNFAILLQIKDFEISEIDELVLQIISQVGIGLSLIALTVGFTIIAATLKSLHNREAAIIHLNLMAAMIIGHLIFLIGIDDVSDQKRCKAVAMLLHFFYLVTFFWMLMEGVHIYFRATRVFKNTSHQLKLYYVFSWGTPCLIVMITALVNINFYGTDQACWLSRERGAIWAFAGPVVFVIGMNVIVLVVVLQTFLTIKSINSKTKFEQAKRSTRAAVVLLPLLGITWVFGFLATGSATIFFQYAFALLNSLQGVFICVFHCFTNDDVMKVVKLKYKRSKQQFDAISSHHSMAGRFRSSTNSNRVSAVTGGRKEAFVEKSQMSTAATDTAVM